MNPSTPIPKLRALEVFPFEENGINKIGIRDASGISSKVLMVPQPILYLLSQINGKSTLMDLQAHLMSQFQKRVGLEQLGELIESLDNNLFLESEKFDKAFSKIQDDFKKADVRQPSHSGGAYSSDPEELKNKIDQFFLEGPGAVEKGKETNHLPGLIAPHIDFTRGKLGYAHAYKPLGESNPPDLVIILGTCHQPIKQPFALTQKSFETPLGTCSTDKEVVEKIQANFDEDLFEDEFAHRGEHSIEFQVVMLQYLFDSPPPIVPILCNGFPSEVANGTSPSETPSILKMIEVLKRLIAEDDRKISVIAGVDLSHIGARFGDEFEVDEEILNQLKKNDLEMLDLVLNKDAEGFFNNIASDGDARKVCGLAPIYLLCHLMENKEGSLLHYGQAFDPLNTVSFAAMSF